VVDDTKSCASCAKPLPADAAFCTACGAPQRAGAAASAESSAFELSEAGTSAPVTPATREDEPPAVESEAIDSDLLEIEFDGGDEEDAAAEDTAPEEDTPATAPAPPSLPAADDEAPQTGDTVRMKMSDVAKAWGEEAGPEEGESDASDHHASTGGLPKGFIVAVLASLAVMAMLLYFLV